MNCSCHPFKLAPAGQPGRAGRKIIDAARQNITGKRAPTEGEDALFESLGDIVEDDWGRQVRNRLKGKGGKSGSGKARVYFRKIAGVVHEAVSQGRMGRGVVSDIASATMDGLSHDQRTHLSSLYGEYRAELLKDEALSIIPKDINTPLDAVSLLERGVSEQDVARLAPKLEAAASLQSFVGAGFLGHVELQMDNFVTHGRRVVNAAAAAMEERYGTELATELFDAKNLTGERQILHPELTRTHRETVGRIAADPDHPLNPALSSNLMPPEVVARLDLEIRANPREAFRILTDSLDQPGALNMSNLVSAEGPARLLHGLQQIAATADRFVDTTEGWTELEIKAYHRFADIIDPANRDSLQLHLLDSADTVQAGFQSSRQNFLAAQWAVNHLGNRAVEQTRRFFQGTLGDDELAELAQTLSNLDQVRDTVTRWRSEAGRSLAATRLQVGAPEQLAPDALRRTRDLVIDSESVETDGFRRALDPRGAPSDEMTNPLASVAKDRGLLEEGVVDAASAALKPFEDLDGFKRFLSEEIKPLLDASASDDEALQKILAMNKVARGPGGLGAVLKEWRYGSMLSSPRTLAVNLIGSVATAYARPLEMMLGASFRGDTATIRKAVNEVVALSQNMRDGWKYAKAAFAEGPQLKAGETVEGYAERGVINNSPEGPLGFVGDGIFGAAVNFMGSAIRTPGKLLQATDEAVKQMQYRTTFMSETADRLMDSRGLSPTDAWKEARVLLDDNVRDGQAYGPGVVYRQGMALAEQQGVPEGMRKAFAKNYMERNYDSVLGQISRDAVGVADEVTFQTPLRPGSVSKMLQDASQKHWVLNLAIPFVRTPTNLLRTAAQHVDPFGPIKYAANRWKNGGQLRLHGEIHNRFLQEMASSDPAARARAIGRLSFGWSAMTTVGLAYASGHITGGGPSDPKQRELMRQTGWKPYSIRTSDGQYFSYERFDPLAGIMSLAADAFEYVNSAEGNDEEFMQTAMMALTSSLSRQLDNKSYLSGLTDMLGALGNDADKLPKALGGLTGSFVPTVVSDLGRTSDPYEREMRDWLDGFRKRIPGLSVAGVEGREGLPIMRNMFGEPISGAKNAAHSILGEDSAAANWLGMVVPVAYSSVGDDGIDEELQLLGKGFSPPSGIKGGMDLRLIEKDGQVAYDRWQELQGSIKLDGMTLREAVKTLMASDQYQAWTPESTEEVESPRLGAIRGLISKFRAAAFNKLQREFPEIRRGLVNQKQARAKTLLGVDVTL